MRLKAAEFLRRFLLHVLPSGFVRIRHYGFLANRVCREKLALCRTLLEGASSTAPLVPAVSATPEPGLASPPPALLCPSCGVGRMVNVETFGAIRDAPRPTGHRSVSTAWDTS